MYSSLCAHDGFACFLVSLLIGAASVTFVMLLLGAAVGWFARGITPDGANKSAEVLVILVTVAMRAWSWMFDQGGALWALQRLTLVLGLLVLVFVLPLILSLAAVAIVRDGTEIWVRIRRLVLSYSLIPVIYLLVYQSGAWPSRISEHAMTMEFYWNRSCFERLETSIDDGEPPVCHLWWGGRLRGRPEMRGTDAVYVGYWSVGLYRDELAKGYVYARTPPRALVDNLDASPVYNPGYQAFYRHLTGNWYLRYSSE